MIPLQGPAQCPETVLYYISLWLKKLNGFLMEKKIIFQIIQVESFKNLEILQSKRDFCNFLQVITFDTFHASKFKFYYTRNTT